MISVRTTGKACCEHSLWLYSRVCLHRSETYKRNHIRIRYASTTFATGFARNVIATLGSSHKSTRTVRVNACQLSEYGFATLRTESVHIRSPRKGWHKFVQEAVRGPSMSTAERMGTICAA